MDYIQKIKLLNELMLNATPQNVDFMPQNGNYCVALIATRPVHTWGYQKRNFKIKGRLEEGKTVSADLIAENEMLFGVEDLPYVAHEGDRTPIFKIIRASIFCAYAGLQLTDLHWGMRKIAWSDYPFKRPDKEEQAKSRSQIYETSGIGNDCSGSLCGRTFRGNPSHFHPFAGCYAVQQGVRTVLIWKDKGFNRILISLYSGKGSCR